MQKTKAVFSSNSFWLVLIIVVLTLMSISLWLDFIKANKSIPPENPGVQAQSVFRGPVGEPHIIGPSGPPPGQ
ncbi:MAG TPA: hypothetical protein VJL32_03490 [Candidatus Paceibacterota bacterium]